MYASEAHPTRLRNPWDPLPSTLRRPSRRKLNREQPQGGATLAIGLSARSQSRTASHNQLAPPNAQSKSAKLELRGPLRSPLSSTRSIEPSVINLRMVTPWFKLSLLHQGAVPIKSLIMNCGRSHSPPDSLSGHCEYAPRVWSCGRDKQMRDLCAAFHLSEEGVSARRALKRVLVVGQGSQ